jgi:hemin uptake protein HemP
MMGPGDRKPPQDGGEPAPDARTGRGADAEIRTIGARELLGARGILRIEHEGELYTLRVTRNNRLILTK